MSKGVLTVVSGFSGAGKGTVMKRLLEKYENYALSISVTTRKPREGERDGIEYFFRTREEVEAMIQEDQLLEHAEYVGNYYGTPRFYVEDMLSQGKNVILEIEIQGAMKIKEKIPEAVLVFVTPPTIEELRSRLIGRGTETADVIASRLRRAAEESEGMIGGLIYSILTITLRVNQNVTGLALTIFGTGFGNFFGGSISKLAGGVGQISVKVTGSAYTAKIPGLSKIPVIGPILFNYGFMTYLCVIVAVVLSFFLFKTRAGLNLRAIGENPGTADAAGINVIKYKYLSTCIGAGLAGLGGLYFVMEYSGGTWTDNGFGDRGWLAVALVIFALWKPLNAIWGAFLFGALYILYLYIPGLGRSMQEVFKALPYVVTIIVLVFTSFRKKKEHQPPAGLGLPYFREER